MSSNTTPRVTVAALAQIVAQQGAIMAQQGEQIGQILALLTAPATTATVVTAITDAPSAKAGKAPKAGKGGKATACKSFADGEALAATGVNADKITVPAGKFGRDGVQTLTQARAKRTEQEAKRAEYLAEREQGNTGERKAATATAPKAATANPYFAMSKDALIADGSAGAQAELNRRAAKRAAKK